MLHIPPSFYYQMGLCTGFGGGGALVDLVGYKRALDLVVSGRKLGLEEGLRLGYFDGQLDADGREIEQGTGWLLKRVKHCSPQSIRNIKAVLQLREGERGKL